MAAIRSAAVLIVDHQAVPVSEVRVSTKKQKQNKTETKMTEVSVENKTKTKKKQTDRREKALKEKNRKLSHADCIGSKCVTRACSFSLVRE